VHVLGERSFGRCNVTEQGKVNGSADAPARRYDHERLDVYHHAVEFIEWRRGVLRRVPKLSECVADQLTRAATSIPLNIAEASGEFSMPERVRFFRIARRSATECMSILDVIRASGLESPEKVAEGKRLLSRIVAMLTPLAKVSPP
jgi:four helix bundle protein